MRRFIRLSKWKINQGITRKKGQRQVSKQKHLSIRTTIQGERRGKNNERKDKWPGEKRGTNRKQKKQARKN